MSKLNTTKYPITSLLKTYFLEIVKCNITDPVRLQLLEDIVHHIKENDDAIECYKLLLPWVLKNSDNIAFNTLFIIVYFVLNTKDSYIPELADGIHTIFTIKILTNDTFYGSRSLEMWCIKDKKTYSNIRDSDLVNHTYYSHK